MEINFDNLEIDLEINALDSLIHGLEHLLNTNVSKTDLKYTILHLAQSVELFIKARLAREHHLLIFAKPENCTLDDKTVTFEDAIRRLLAIRVKISKEAVSGFKELQKLRNQIQHYKCVIKKEEVENIIGQIFKYLETFLEKELGIILKDKLEKEKYSILQNAFYTYEELLSKAEEKIEELIPSEVDLGCYAFMICPNCLNKTLIYPDPRDEINNSYKTKCFFCDSEYPVNTCQKCGRFIFYEDKQCTECWYNEQNYK